MERTHTLPEGDFLLIGFQPESEREKFAKEFQSEIEDHLFGDRKDNAGKLQRL